ncbi:hypothetical protein CHARACLAT_031812 [Characodon lateralis]|uniref:Dehydrogenase/reductase SDR family member 11 n=1 Tax=Characodon lateralis TaxID=208331 RepID=A0ABU7D2F0_9TELE|nr:hypothetical protein [Characodon lateralis]
MLLKNSAGGRVSDCRLQWRPDPIQVRPDQCGRHPVHVRSHQSAAQGVDVCINNAGLAHPEPLLSGKTSGWKNMLDVNIMPLSICTREAYQSMKERNIDDGHIINLNSIM